jgi:hypothetical protein
LTRRTLSLRLGAIGIVAATIICTLFATVAMAGNGHGGTSTASTGCTAGSPGVSFENNYAWGQSGAWGLPGQQIGFQIQVRNYDVGCSSSSFNVSVSAPSGFAVSLSAPTISVSSSGTGYLWAYVTAPATAADGDYPLTVTVSRSGSSASAGSYLKVYSSDIAAPTLFWSNPVDGQAISGRSYTFNVSSSDDHAVKKIDLYVDGAYVTTTTCDDLTYICQLSYKWSMGRAIGAHTATFKSTDWMGNVGVLAVGFVVTK